MSSATPLQDALQLHKSGRVTEAEAAYRRILADQPRNLDALQLLGMARQAQGDMDGAVGFIRQALAVPAAADPGIREALLLRLGQILVLDVRLAEARSVLTELSAINPGNGEAQRLLQEVGARGAALSRMERIVARRPLRLTLETVTLCNARCGFCAYRKTPRPKTIMTMELFDKICREYDELGGGLIGFSPLMSDPLVDPLLMDRIRLIVERHHGLTPHMFTNAIGFRRLSDEDLRFLLKHLDHIDISLGGLNRDDYRTMYGVDKFADVRDSLDRLARLNEEMNWPCRLCLHFRTNKKEEISRSPLLAELVALGFEATDILDAFSDWGGDISQDDLPPGARLAKADNTNATSACLIPTAYFSVLPDGRVTACMCMDAQERFIVGDLKTQSISEIWNGDILRDFRASFQPGRVPEMCRTCSSYGPSRRVLSSPGLSRFRIRQNFWSFV